MQSDARACVTVAQFVTHNNAATSVACQHDEKEKPPNYDETTYSGLVALQLRNLHQSPEESSLHLALSKLWHRICTGLCAACHALRCSHQPLYRSCFFGEAGSSEKLAYDGGLVGQVLPQGLLVLLCLVQLALPFAHFVLQLLDLRHVECRATSRPC